jgi:hypothetical protein
MKLLVIAMLAACHAAPIATVQMPHVATTPAPAHPIRQDYDDARPAMPLAEVITTGHECNVSRTPILFVGRDVVKCKPIVRRR